MGILPHLHPSPKSYNPAYGIEATCDDLDTLTVVHLSTYDVAGGAARAAYRIHRGLRGAGIQSVMFVREARSRDASIVTFEPTRKLLGRLGRRFRRERMRRELQHCATADNVEPFRLDRSEYGTDLAVNLPRADIVNLHWVVDFVDYPSFFETLPDTTPIVWTLHDMNPFTGGCHYDLGCGRYLSRCHGCPQLQSEQKDDLSSRIWDRKKAMFARLNPERLHIATPSAWLANEVRRSPILSRFPVTIIPYGIDPQHFSPRHRESAREVFGIPQKARTVLFVADGLPLVRKGFAALSEALNRVAHRIPNATVICVGHNDPPPGLRIPWIHLGYIQNDRLLSNIYSAADVFVIPSLQDNLPNTVLEAMACGTPVVGFDVGGIPEMVQHGRTGLLVQPNDAAQLGDAIVQLLTDADQRDRLGRNSRRAAVHRFSPARQAAQYYDLFRTLLRRAT